MWNLLLLDRILWTEDHISGGCSLVDGGGLLVYWHVAYLQSPFFSMFMKRSVVLRFTIDIEGTTKCPADKGEFTIGKGYRELGTIAFVSA